MGHHRVQIRRIQRDGQPLLEIEQTMAYAVQRAGQSANIETTFTERDTLDGRLVDVEGAFSDGGAPVPLRGHVEGKEFVMEVGAPGRQRRVAVPWIPGAGGLWGVELSLRRDPLEPGATRTLHGLMQGVNLLEPREFVLAARDYEETDVLGRTCRLLRVDMQIPAASGQGLDAVLWVDQSGDVLKSQIDMGQPIVTCRASREEALEQTGSAQVDLIEDMSVRIDPPPRDPHEARWVRYRVELTDGDPGRTFPSGGSQTVRRLDAHTAEITVRAVRPATATPAAPDPRPTDADRAPNSLVQSDNAAVVQMAHDAVAGEQDPWRRAVLLERRVHEAISVKDYARAFSSAVEALESRQGDCTEHAVLLAALARAVGLPARVAVGLLYVETDNTMGFHMWTEIFIDGKWIPMDATLSQGGIGAGHLKLLHSSLKDASSCDLLWPLAKVLGQTKIQIVEME